jgi:calcineurin-like phosphoesterase family protein
MFDFVIADTHFGHKNILKYEPGRNDVAKKFGYRSFDEMMIDRWNDTISKESKVFHLGDVAFGKGYKGLDLLNGEITLLVGNHDSDNMISHYREFGWSIIDGLVLDIPKSQDYIITIKNAFSTKQLSDRLLCALITDIGDERIFFSHFPLFDDNPYDKKYKDITDVLEVLYLETNSTINIHGHTHSKSAKELFCKSACLERTGYEIKEVGYFVK